MFHLQPLMFLGLFPLFAIFEGMLGLLPLGAIEQQIQHCHSELSTVLATEVALWFENRQTNRMTRIS